jgi:ABC-type antimicrobial peptide transport system permease subunit
LQPLILILTVALSVTFTASALTLRDAISEESEANIEAQYGSSDLVVGQGSGSDSRFMLSERANSLLGERGVSVGVFNTVLSLSDRGGSVFAVATDFYTVGDAFDISFSEYLGINEDSLSDSVLISRSLSERLGLSLGGVLEADIFGVSRSFTVSGISEARYLGKYDVMLDIRAVMRVLSQSSAFISAMGDDFLPSTTLYIDLAEGVTVGECISLLSADRDFSGKSYTDVDGIRNSSLITDTLDFVISVSVALIVLVSAAVTFACFYILSLKRTDENESFTLAGARPLIMNSMQYGEILLYWLVGTPLGILLSVPASHLFGRAVGLSYATPALTPSGGVISALVMLLSVLLTATVFILTRGIRRREMPLGKMSLAALVLSSILLVLTFVLVGEARLTVGILSVLSLILLLLLSAPIITKRISALISAALSRGAEADGRGVKSAPIYYGLKNYLSVKVLHNTTRLAALLVVALISTGALVLASEGFMQLGEEMLDGDYAVLSPTERAYGKLSESENGSVMRVYQQSATYGEGKTLTVLSADSLEAFNPVLEVESLPGGSGTVISSTCSEQLSLDVGDEMTVMLGGVPLVLTVEAVADMGIPAAIIDSEHFGIGYNMLLVKADGGRRDAMLSELSTVAAGEMSAVVPTAELVKSHTVLLEIYISAAYVLLLALIVFATIGLADNLSESYRQRRSDFELFRLAGASSRAIAATKLTEVLLSLLLGAFVGILFSLPTLLSLNEAAHSLNFDLFLAIEKLFLLK